MAASRKARKGPRNTDPPDPRVTVLRTAFANLHQTRLRSRYLPVPGRDGTWVKKALATYSEPDIRRALTRYFADGRARKRHTSIPDFVAKIGVLLAEVGPTRQDFTNYSRRAPDEEASS